MASNGKLNRSPVVIYAGKPKDQKSVSTSDQIAEIRRQTGDEFEILQQLPGFQLKYFWIISQKVSKSAG